MITHTLAGWRDAVSTSSLAKKTTLGARSFGILVYQVAVIVCMIWDLSRSNSPVYAGLIGVASGSFCLGLVLNKCRRSLRKKYPVPGIQIVIGRVMRNGDRKKMRKRGGVFVPLASLHRVTSVPTNRSASFICASRIHELKKRTCSCTLPCQDKDAPCPKGCCRWLCRGWRGGGGLPL